MDTAFLGLAQAAGGAPATAQGGASAPATGSQPTGDNTTSSVGAPPAAGAQQQPNPCGGGGGMQSILLMVLMFAVFYFLLIRPQQKRAKQHQAMLSAIKKGDQVVTRGGMIGRVSGVQDNILTVELQEKVRVRVLRSYVEGKYQEGATTPQSETKAD